LRQMPVTPASIATRRRQEVGRMPYLYSADCWSKISKHGIETTRVPSPSSLAAATASWSSLPVERRMVWRGAVSWTAM
jgi:hypothetical protein